MDQQCLDQDSKSFLLFFTIFTQNIFRIKVKRVLEKGRKEYILLEMNKTSPFSWIYSVKKPGRVIFLQKSYNFVSVVTFPSFLFPLQYILSYDKI